MGEWRTHRACNRFDESKVIGHHGRELARFNHFKDRYVNQLESLRLEGINYRNLESKINDMKNDFSMTNNEVIMKYLLLLHMNNSRETDFETNFRCDSFVMLSKYCMSVAVRFATLLCLHIFWRRITTLKYLKTIKATWKQPLNAYQDIWSKKWPRITSLNWNDRSKRATS